MRIRLVRKFANILNGIDLSNLKVGDVVDMAPHHAAMLVAEGWAQDVTNEPPHGFQKPKPSDLPEPRG